MPLAVVFLHLIFRNPDGSLTDFSWYFAAVATFMVISGIWSLISPESYRRFSLGSKRAQASKLPPLWLLRTAGGVGIVAAVGFMGWAIFFSTPGKLY